MMQRQQKVIYLVSIAIFILFCGIVGRYIGIPMVRFAQEPEVFRSWVDASGILGRIMFVGMVILQVIVAFIPGEAIELAAGFAFGAIEGTILSMIGIVLGSWFIFLLVRKYGVKMVEVFFSKEKISQISFLKSSRRSKVLAFILMLIPGTPKDFISYFAGLTKLELRQWLFIVMIARLPSVLTSTLTGAAAGEKQYALAVVLFILSGLISIAGILYYHYICRLENEVCESV